MLKAFKVALRTNKTQNAFFEKCVAHSRFVYNKFLEHKQNTYQARLYLEDLGLPDAKEYTKMPTKLGSSKWLTELKGRFQWLYESDSKCLTGALDDCDKAFKNFFQGLKSGRHVGFPKFKSKHRDKPSFYVHNNCLKILHDSVKLAKIGQVRFFEKGYVPVDRKVSFGTISKEVDRWFLSVIVDVEEPVVQSKLTSVVGIDVGLSNWLTLSDGTVVPGPRFYREGQDCLKKLSKRFSRAKNGSKRREKLKAQLQKWHARIARQRADLLHKTTTHLTNAHTGLIVEDLSLKGLMRTRLAKSFSDASLGELGRQLEYKGRWYGCEVKKVDRFFPSSKLCSGCGWKNEELKLGDREWLCKKCGATHDRDLNAAKNLAQYFERYDGDNQASWCSKEPKSKKSKPKGPVAGQTIVTRRAKSSGVLENSSLTIGDET